MAKINPLSPSRYHTILVAAPMDTRRTSFSSTTSSAVWDEPEDLIPTAVVIKNIPFAVKRDQLLDVMSKLGLPLPYAFNYHFDNGVFRGLAFANFNSPDETSTVVSVLNGREIGGRKLRVEYKKMLPPVERDRIEREKREKRGQLEEQHMNESQTSLVSLGSQVSHVSQAQAQAQVLQVPGSQGIAGSMGSVSGANCSQSNGNNGHIHQGQNMPKYVILSSPAQAIPGPAGLDLNNPEILEIYTKLVVFRDSNSPYSELVFSLATITSFQRRTISALVDYLGLSEANQAAEVIVKRVDPMGLLQSQHQQGGGNPAGQGQLSLQQQPSLIRSHSHTLGAGSANGAGSAAGLTFQASRLRQQPSRTVSQTHQQQFTPLSSLVASPSTQPAPLLNHSSSSASLNLMRGYNAPTGGLTAPATPNPSQARAAPNSQGWFNNPQLTGGTLANHNAILNHQQLTGGSFASTHHTGGSFASNQPQLTGGSFSNVDDLFASLDLTMTAAQSQLQL